MRNLLVAALAAVALGACSVGADGGADPSAAAPAEGYTLQVVADEGRQVYLVTHSDGRAAAAKVENGASEIMDAGAAQTEVSERLGVLGATSEAPVAVRFPGFSMSIAGQDGGENGDRVRIAINAGGREVLVDAEDTNRDDQGQAVATAPVGEGAHVNVDDTDRATVRIAGADEQEARDFINDAENLSAETKAQMLAALNLQ